MDTRTPRPFALRRPPRPTRRQSFVARLLALVLAVAGLAVSQTNHATVSLAGQQLSQDGRVQLTVTASPTSLPAGGGTVTYTYTVRNTGQQNLWSHTEPAVTDPSCSPLRRVSGEWAPVYPGATITYQCTRTVTQTTTSTASANYYYYPYWWSAQTANTSVSAATTVTVGASTTQSPFACVTPTVWVAQNPAGSNATQLYVQYTTATSSSFIQVGTNSEWGYNALAYNPKDGYLYAVSNWRAEQTMPDAAGHLLRIDASGNVRDLGAITLAMPAGSTIDDAKSDLGRWPGQVPGGMNAGTIDPATGTYYIANMASGTGQIYTMNLSTLTPSLTARWLGTAANSTQVANDFTFSGGYLLGINNNTSNLVRFDTRTGSWLANTPVANLGSATYGAVWTYGNGNVGMDANSGATLAQVTTGGTLVNSTKGLPTSNNDGANCTGTQGADLAVDKSGTVNVAPNGTVTFALTVTNNGPGVSSGGYVSDTVPSAYTNVAVEAAYQQMCTVTGNSIRCQTGVLNPGDSYTITVTAKAPASGTATTLKNTATVTGNEPDPTPGNNTDDHTPAITNAVIDLAKTAASATSTANADGSYTATYTITVRNTGNGAGTYGPVTDRPTLPAGATLAAATWSGGPGTVAATTMTPDDTGTYAFGPTTSLAAGAAHTYTVALRYTLAAGATPTACAANGGIRNLASTTGETASARTDNNEACVDLAPVLDVAKSPGTVTGPDANGVYTAAYTVVVTNPGPVAGSYPQVVDTPRFGSAATVVGATAARNGGTAQTFTGSGPYTLSGASTALAAGAKDTYAVAVRFTVAAGQASTLASCGTTPAPGTGLFNSVSMTGDADPSNNGACDGTVDVAKTSGTVTGPDAQGTYTATYTVTVTNSGPATTYGPLTDTPAFPSATTITGASVSRNGAAAQGLTGAGPYTLAGAGTTLAAGARDTYALSIRYTVADGRAAEVTGCAAGSGTGGLRNTVALPNDFDPSNNAACDTPLGFAVSKSLAAGQAPEVVLSGTTWSASYTITVTNRGTTTATSPQVTDVPSVPSGVTIGRVTVDGVSVTGSPYVVTPGVSLAPGASRDFAVVVSGTLEPSAVSATAGSCDTAGAGNPALGLFNAVTMRDDLDGPANNDACVSFTTTRVLHLVKVDGSGAPLPGAAFALFDTDPSGAGATPITDGITADASGGTTFTSTALTVGKTYWVVERRAPAGHELLPSPARVLVTATGVQLVGETPGVHLAGTDAFTLQVSDPRSAALPATGGAGAGLPVGGLAVVLLALGGLLVRRRRHALA